MADSVIDTVIKLAKLATSDNDGEANNAARKACDLIRENEALLTAARTLDLPTAQANVHPDVRAHFAVEKLLHDNWLISRETYSPGRCAACGGKYGHGAQILAHEHLNTHHSDRCLPWWIDHKHVAPEADPPALPGDDGEQGDDDAF